MGCCSSKQFCLLGYHQSRDNSAFLFHYLWNQNSEYKKFNCPRHRSRHHQNSSHSRLPLQPHLPQHYQHHKAEAHRGSQQYRPLPHEGPSSDRHQRSGNHHPNIRFICHRGYLKSNHQFLFGSDSRLLRRQVQALDYCCQRLLPVIPLLMPLSSFPRLERSLRPIWRQVLLQTVSSRCLLSSLFIIEKPITVKRRRLLYKIFVITLVCWFIYDTGGWSVLFFLDIIYRRKGLNHNIWYLSFTVQFCIKICSLYI